MDRRRPRCYCSAVLVVVVVVAVVAVFVDDEPIVCLHVLDVVQGGLHLLLEHFVLGTLVHEFVC